jgi:hypothetical protein
VVEVRDIWQIRFPDGRVLRAAAKALRHHFLAGRIPVESQLRRTAEEEWRPLAEFPELTTPTNSNGTSTSSWTDFTLDSQNKSGTVASRLDSAQLRQPGIRPFLEEMLAALDSALAFKKVLATAFVGLLVAALAFVGMGGLPKMDLPPWGPWLCLGGAVLLLLGLMAMLTRMTFTEVSRLRPSRFRDGLRGMAGVVVKLAFTWGIAVAALVTLSWSIRQVPAWLPERLPAWWEWTPAVVGAAMFVLGVLECLLWASAVFFGPLASVWVVEDCSFLQGVALWDKLVSPIRWRIFVGQWLALGLAGLMAAPLLLVGFSAGGQALALAAAGTLAVAYYSVANVFLYLHLRYEVK